ncbi:insulinase family protein [Prevotella sp. E15-22]|uniref:M16 family metallopeptidase n=1 Tax=Prevotella sp. E15-22 TaxID=2937774 RepID=UPI00205C0C3F|nr:M16 family metallopeptidase [Prevotella sp. E15-22]UPS44691.1 insulinase family protein [Prevotella sp. E15-22]
MNLKKLFFASLLLVTASATTMAQEMPSIPTDPDVKVGKLDNGLTYYIRHNAWPEQRAEFYIAQRVGAIQENDDQRGLAHFLEHMCFNGTDNFKGNDIVKWCETVGVKFGRDLNAYTSIDQTVYNISNVPTTREGIIDSCLLILHDWADGLLLEPEEIDKERGVIHEEWRMRTSAQMRMLERDLPRLYPNSKYGHRMPIGLMEVIDNFKPEVLRAYYEKWYRPDNQAIIVVGDVDVDKVEQKIKNLFAPIKMPANPAPVVAEAVPDNQEAIIVVDKDKEMQYSIVQLMFKSDPIPDEMKSNMQYLVIDYLKDACMGMLNDRLTELAQKADCPYLQGGVEYDQYLLSKTKDAFNISVLPKEGQTEAALKAAFIEARRAAQFGFTATEYQRYKQNFLSQLDKQYSNKDKRFNSQFVNEYVKNYLAKEPIPSLDDYYQVMKQVVPMLPLETINELMKNFFEDKDSNMVVLNMNQEKDGAVYPTEASLKKAIDEARATQLEAYVDNVKNEPLITKLPKAGKIVKEVAGKKFDYKELTLSNGAKVILKHTDLKKDQVILASEGFGGSSRYGEKDFANIKLFDDVIEASGLGNFSHTELEKALAGKIASASMALGTDRANITGSSTPTDVETMLQLVYLYFTNINKDQESYDNMMKTTELMLKNKLLQPEAVFSDSLTLTIQNHSKRFAPLAMDDLKNVDYDRILQMAKEQTSNAAAFTFTIIGNYDEATIRPLIEQYLASLPAQKKVVKGKDVDEYFKGEVINNFKRKMETPKAIAVMVWLNDQMKYSLENVVRADMVGQILSMIYTEKIREEASAAYSVMAQAGMSRDDYRSIGQVLVYCPMKPEKGDVATKIMLDEVNNMVKSVDAEKLNKVKEYMLKNIDDQAKTNNYWIRAIGRLRDYGVDVYTDYKKTVEAQTPQTIAAFMQEFLKPGNRAEIVMLPEE